jgi:hypothetical protein
MQINKKVFFPKSRNRVSFQEIHGNGTKEMRLGSGISFFGGHTRQKNRLVCLIEHSAVHSLFNVRSQRSVYIARGECVIA